MVISKKTGTGADMMAKAVSDESYDLVIGEVDNGIRNMLGIEIPSQNSYYSDDRIMLRGLKRAYNAKLPVAA